MLVALIHCSMHTAQPIWNPKGIYIINKADGELTIRWDENGKTEERKLMPVPIKRPNDLSVLHIPVMAPGTKIKISFHDMAPAHADFPSCQEGSHLSFTTNKRMVLYVIHGGYDAEKAAFNRPGTGHHCHIKLHHQRFTAQGALETYPILAGDNYLPEQ